MFSLRPILSYVASVSDRVIARKLEREQKKDGRRGRGGLTPLPLALNSSFLLSSQLSRRTRAERLVTKARVIYIPAVETEESLSLLYTKCYLLYVAHHTVLPV